MKFILASQSPKRKEILTQLGFQFEVIPSHVEELVDLPSIQLVEENAKLKAVEIAKIQTDAVILGVDTVVVVSKDNEEKIFLKPESKVDAVKMFEIYDQVERSAEKNQSNQINKVISGLCLIVPNQNGGTRQTFIKHEISEFKLNQFANSEQGQKVKKKLFFQIADKEKSGGFTIEGEGAILFDEIKGSYFNILGLPIHALYQMMLEAELIWEDFKLPLKQSEWTENNLEML